MGAWQRTRKCVSSQQACPWGHTRRVYRQWKTGRVSTVWIWPLKERTRHPWACSWGMEPVLHPSLPNYPHTHTPALRLWDRGFAQSGRKFQTHQINKWAHRLVTKRVNVCPCYPALISTLQTRFSAISFELECRCRIWRRELANTELQNEEQNSHV